MKQLGVLLIGIVLAPIHLLAGPVTVTLKDAVRSAIEKTEPAFIAHARVSQADARITQTRSRFFPSLSFESSYQQQGNGVLSRQSSALFGGGQAYARFTLTQSLYEGGRDLSTLDSNKADKEVQRQNLSIANYNTFTQVARGFYAILSNQTEVENIKRTIRLATDRVKEISSREKIGRSRNFELAAARAQVSGFEADLMASEGQLITAWDQFVLLTDLSRDVQLIKTKEVPEPPQPLATYISLIENRPDIAAIKAQIENARSNISVAKSGHFPSVALLGNYYLIREGTQKGNNWDAGVTLTFPVFRGGLVSGQVREASEKEEEVEYLLRQTRRQAEIAIRTAYNNLASSLNQIEALKSALNAYEQSYEEQSKNYSFGQATNIDVIQALNFYQDTKRKLDRTRYLALSAWAELKAATGQVSLAELKGDS